MLKLLSGPLLSILCILISIFHARWPRLRFQHDLDPSRFVLMTNVQWVIITGKMDKPQILASRFISLNGPKFNHHFTILIHEGDWLAQGRYRLVLWL